MSIRILAIPFVAVLGSVATTAQQESALRAELLSRVTARSVVTGDRVLARVDEEWRGSGCDLRRGAILEAIVQAVRPRFGRSSPSELALLFVRAECGGSGLRPLRLTLAAIAAPAQPQGELTVELPIARVGSVQPPAGAIAPQVGEWNVQRTAADAQWTPRPGEVRGLQGLKLSVATGPAGSSVLSDYAGDVELNPQTRLVLVPDASGAAASPSFVPAPPQPPAAPPVTVLSASAAAPDDCLLPACSGSPSSSSTSSGGRYSGAIPLATLGFTPRLTIERTAPSLDEALAWLAPDELLVAFNPHELVPRNGLNHAEPTMRVIRAALFNTSTRRLLKLLEWPTKDRGQFLWILPDNRVLVHVNDELRIYGAGLRIERRVRLAGRLAFLRMAPDARRLGLGIIRERHQPSLHATLSQILDREPEEDLQLVTLDDKLETIATTISTTRVDPPVLLNEGQVGLSLPPGQGRGSNKRYELRLRTWTSAERIIASLHSTCVPRLSTVPPDLLFVVTCDNLNHSPEYRFLRPNGTTALHGHSMLKEIGHSAGRAGPGESVALRIFEASEPITAGTPFAAADLNSVDLFVYRCSDGRRLFDVRVSRPMPSSAGYAVSTSGTVAVLAQDGVDLYAMRGR